MNNYGFSGVRPGIEISEVSAVKDMIFNKAREKSSSLAQEKEENMTASLQNDVMNQARASISGSRIKPFGNLTQSTSKSPTPEIINPQVDIMQEAPKLKHNVSSADNSVYTASMHDETMNAARNQFSRRTSLTESLKFLNTQAAIRMVNKTHSKIV